MAADAWLKYNTFPEYFGDGTIDLDDDAFKMQLHTSSYTPTADGDAVRADLSDEHANANGYTTAGFAVAVTWVRSTATVTFDSADGVWTASGGSIVCRYAVVYDDTPAAPLDPLCFYSLLDNAPADVTVTTGNQLTVAINASGCFTVTGMS